MDSIVIVELRLVVSLTLILSHWADVAATVRLGRFLWHTALLHPLARPCTWFQHQKMPYWHAVLLEVLNRDNKAYVFRYTNVGPAQILEAQERCSIEKEEQKNYYLGACFPEVYLTPREAECMVHLLAGKTNAKTARSMGLSPRTIEFYIKNMRDKLRSRNKAALIAAVRKSEFYEHLDEFEALHMD